MKRRPLFLFLVATALIGKGAADLTRFNVVNVASAAPAAFANNDANVTTPIEFSIGGIRYRMPRNYIWTFSATDGQAFIHLRVNIPSMEPFTDHTHDCFEQTSVPAAVTGLPECDPVDVMIGGPAGLSAEQIFDNAKAIFVNKEPVIEFGYERYKIGDGDSVYYRKIESDGRTVLYLCITRNFCTALGDTLSTGAQIRFEFKKTLLKDIGPIDANLRKLVESFVVQP